MWKIYKCYYDEFTSTCGILNVISITTYFKMTFKGNRL